MCTDRVLRRLDVVYCERLLRRGAAALPLRRQRVALRVAEDDVFMALADVPVLRDVVGA